SVHDQGKSRDILGYHGPGPHHGIFADCVAADDCGVGPDACPPADQGGTELVLALHKGTRIEDIREHRAGTHKDLVLQCHALIDRDIVLDLAAVADAHIRPDHDVLAEHAVCTDAASGEDMGEMPDLRAVADHRTCIHHGGLMREIAHAAAFGIE